jgi:hypothetical protein
VHHLQLKRIYFKALCCVSVGVLWSTAHKVSCTVTVSTSVSCTHRQADTSHHRSARKATRKLTSLKMGIGNPNLRLHIDVQLLS